MNHPLLPASYRGAKFEMFVIYDNLSDYPGEYVVRRWLIGAGVATSAEISFRGTSLEQARRFIPDHADTCIIRSPDDDRTIVESWI